MKVLLVGVGGVGEAIAAIAKPRKWMELMVLADFNVKRAEEVQKKLGDVKRFPVEFTDASNQNNIEMLAKKYQVDLIMNSVDPIFNKQIFDAAYNVGATYMDMAMTLSEPHPTDPFNQTGIKLGDYQFEKAKDWESKKLLALVGFGVEPGMADVFGFGSQPFPSTPYFGQWQALGVIMGEVFIVIGFIMTIPRSGKKTAPA